ncbi:hypothetical protein [Mycobacterium sp. SMC-13]|uniref:hypothetical protein n=1 Tax=Mycobacterium sp. SMC-13 TaxID=3381626 RepID=UPI003876FC5C
MDDEARGDGGDPWHVYSGPVYSFAVVLRAAGVLPLDEDEYWEEPHKWDPEHRLWVELGSPRCPEPGDPPSLAWQRFLRATAEFDNVDD